MLLVHAQIEAGTTGMCAAVHAPVSRHPRPPASFPAARNGRSEAK
jgi:hypothetical protein